MRIFRRSYEPLDDVDAEARTEEAILRRWWSNYIGSIIRRSSRYYHRQQRQQDENSAEMRELPHNLPTLSESDTGDEEGQEPFNPLLFAMDMVAEREQQRLRPPPGFDDVHLSDEDEDEDEDAHRNVIVHRAASSPTVSEEDRSFSAELAATTTGASNDNFTFA